MRKACLIRRLGDAPGPGLEFHPVSSCPQVIMPVRTGHGYVYEYPSRQQKDVYDIPPSHSPQGVRTRNAATRGDRHWAAEGGELSFRASEERDVHGIGIFHAALS